MHGVQAHQCVMRSAPAMGSGTDTGTQPGQRAFRGDADTQGALFPTGPECECRSSGPTAAFLGMGSTEKQQAGMESKKNQVLTTSVKPCNPTSCSTDRLLFA